MTDPISSIHQDHRNLEKVLSSLLGIVAKIGDHLDRTKPVEAVDALYSVLHYIRVYPDRHHHPKEDKFVLAPIRKRAADKLDKVKEIEAQHAGAGRLTDELAAAVEFFDGNFPNGYADLATRATTYVSFQRGHMHMEETVMIPLAEELLTDDERRAAGRAFSEHADPLFQDNIEAGFQSLLDRISRAAAKEQTNVPR